MRFPIFFLVFVLLAARLVAAENLVPSGSFEDLAAPPVTVRNNAGVNAFTPWRVYSVHDSVSEVPRSVIAELTPDAADGKQALSLEFNESDDTGDAAVDLDSELISVELGETYEISFSAKNGGGSPQILLVVTEHQGDSEARAVQQFKETFELSSEYKSFSMKHTVGGGSLINLAFRPNDPATDALPANACKLFLDNVQMKKVEAR